MLNATYVEKADPFTCVQICDNKL